MVLHTARVLHYLWQSGDLLYWMTFKDTKKKKKNCEVERERREKPCLTQQALCLIWIKSNPAEVSYLNDFAKEVVLSNLFKSFCLIWIIYQQRQFDEIKKKKKQQLSDKEQAWKSWI